LNKPIVVLTPVKNEEWILERFLSVTSNFADLIIVADQNSADKSVSICSRFSKVHLINNTSETYDEAYRQSLLINEARKLIPSDKILLALDADEILTADSYDSKDWELVEGAASGTVLYFEKPDLYKNTETCIRYDQFFPLGYVDDGCDHSGKILHSIRIPVPEYSSKLYLKNVKFLHHGLLQMRRQRAKDRIYSVITNIANNDTIIKSIRRRIEHSRFYDYSKCGSIKNTPKSWLDYQSNKVDALNTIKEEKFYYQDLELLRILNQHGFSRFWWDDIFNEIDLEQVRKYFLAKGIDELRDLKIKSPPFLLKIILNIIDYYIMRANRKILINNN